MSGKEALYNRAAWRQLFSNIDAHIKTKNILQMKKKQHYIRCCHQMHNGCYMNHVMGREYIHTSVLTVCTNASGGMPWCGVPL